ncbi:prion-inhibition and propagation-domain-containing protein [Xylaria sp. FL1777]|nr:prion-inhibition and propagation-domain-containing protein [Xylaria sp. FL1777]
MEAIGLVASVISIGQLAKGVIDLYEIVSDVKHAWKELEEMQGLFRLERMRFFLWCDYVGLTTLTLLKQNSGEEPTWNEFLSSRTSAVLRQEWTLEIIGTTLKNITCNFKDVDKLLANYTTKRAPSILTRLTARLNQSDDRIQLALAHLDLSKDRTHCDTSKGTLRVIKRLPWSFVDKKKFRTFISNLQDFNNGLDAILSGIEKLELKRQNELLATSSPFGSIIMALRSEGQRPNIDSRILGSLPQLLELKERALILDDVNNRAPLNTMIFKPGSYSATQGLHLVLSDIEFQEAQDLDLGRRLIAKHGGLPCLVEWKYYSRRITPDKLAYIRQRTSMLVLQLQQSAETPGFSILNCVGHFEDDANFRIGIVYKPAEHTQSIEIKDLVSTMLADWRRRTLRDLECRLAVARALVMTFFRLHQINWLHKSFRSENVLLIKKSGSDQDELGRPYICGFDFSRPDMPYELSESMPTQIRHLKSALEDSLYRHPDLRQESSILQGSRKDGVVRYHKSYDTYSLGVVLVEIAQWCPAKKLIKKGESPMEFHSRLLTDIVPELRHLMGRAYHNVVVKCIMGQFGESHGSEGEESSNEDYQKRSEKWMRSFLKDAVEVFERLVL